jgi:hypothetical protein
VLKGRSRSELRWGVAAASGADRSTAGICRNAAPQAGIGSITLTGARLSPNGLLRLRSFNGDVRLSLAERPADARIMALALNGQVRSEIPLRVRDTWGPRWSEATLGKGEPVISLDVVTGMVEIKSP